MPERRRTDPEVEAIRIDHRLRETKVIFFLNYAPARLIMLIFIMSLTFV
ncbi:MAG: hypothetical protein GY896_19255 [Gammaproteobacteria bacterium]|nr:hypothetical protein [Gammaproteobacteria bacterium]